MLMMDLLFKQLSKKLSSWRDRQEKTSVFHGVVRQVEQKHQKYTFRCLFQFRCLSEYIQISVHLIGNPHQTYF